MRDIQKHHIVDLFVWVDDTLKALNKPAKTGRPPVLSDSELLTVLIWDGLTEGHRTLRQLYDWINREYKDCFPRLPAYQNFIAQCQRNLDNLVFLLSLTLRSAAAVRFCDSTMLEVCKLQRAKQHKVAKAAAAYGYNHQGVHYGFKLHAAIDVNNRLAATVFTPADRYDGQLLERLVNKHTRLAVGDSHYGGSVERKRAWQRFGVIVVAPPHHKQKRKLMAGWQKQLLGLRSKIEASFDELKEHLGLVTSFPRSIKGYFVHYLRVLLGYQMRRVS